jgi:hypothetical protein
MALVSPRFPASNTISPNAILRRLHCLLLLLATALGATALVTAAPAMAQSSVNLTGGQFSPNCGNATAAPIFDADLIGGGVYGVNNLIAVSDPDIVLIGNQWWMIFATGPVPPRAIQPFAAYLPPGASLSTSTTYPADPNGWHLVGAQANGQGTAVPVSGNPGTNGWDALAAETPSVNVNPDGTVSIYYSGHNAGQTPFQIGLMTDFKNGFAYGDPNPVATAEYPWEFSSNLPALLEQSVRWEPQLNKYVMLYTAGAWWAGPPDNTIAYADSTDGVNWVNRQELGFPVSYYNQDFLYNSIYNRYEMVVSNDPTGAGGANPRNIVWRDAATPNATFPNWQNETTLLQYSAANAAGWYNSGALSPSVKYGNLPGEENRIYVFFHAYSQSGNMVIGRFYCDANQTFYIKPSSSAVSVAQGSATNTSITVTPQSGFTGTVNFSVSGLPTGVTSSFSPASSATGTTLSLNVAAGVLPGQYPVTVTGASDGMNQTTTIPLTVTGTTPSLTPQTITFNTIPTQPLGTLNVASFASASSGLPVTFSLVPNGNCILTGTNVAFINYGACGIIAMQAGNSTYAPASQVGQVVNISNSASSQSFTLSLNSSAVTIPAGGQGAIDYVNVVPASGFNSGVTLSAILPSGFSDAFLPGNTTTTNSEFVIVAGPSVTPGAYVIPITGVSGSLSSSVNLNVTVTGTLTAQTITFNSIATQVVGTPLTLRATASSGLAVSYSASPSTVCSVSGATVTLVGSGSCTITASQSGNSTYSAATSVGQTFTVNWQAQAINFAAITTQTVGTPLTLGATASSGLAVSYAASPSTVCSVSGTSATFVGSGSCTITGSQSGSSSYAAATPVSQTFTVKTNQSFTLSLSSPAVTIPSGGQGATDYIYVAPAGGFSGAVTLSATLPQGISDAFIQPGNVTSTNALFVLAAGPSVKPGAYVIPISGVSGSLNASVNLNVTVTGAQTITFGAIATQTVGTPLTLAATASSGLAVSYAASPSTVCAVSGAKVTFAGAGTCTITASQSGNTYYSAATSVSQSFTVKATGPSFTLSAATGTLSQVPGAANGVTDAITVTPANGFTGTVTFSASGIPVGVDYAFVPASSTTGTTFIIYVPAGVAASSNNKIVITGTSGATTAQTSVTLNIP